MKFLKSTFTSFLSNMFGVFITFLTIVVTARLLGPGGNGEWGIAVTVTSFALILLGFGIPSSNVFFVGRDKKDINSIIGANFVVMLIATVGSLIGYFVNLKFNIPFLKGIPDWTIMVIMMTIPFSIIKTSLYYILLGIEEVTNYNKITMLDRTVVFILLFVFMIIFKSARWVIVSNFIACLIMVGRISFILFIKKGYRVSFDRGIFHEMIKYGLKSQVANGIGMINYNLDVLITGSYLNKEAVGLYTKASQLGGTMWKVSGSVGTVVLPYTANTKEKSDITHFINKITRVTFAFILICGICLTIISKPLILLVLSSKFAGSVTPFMLIIPGICIYSVNNIIGNYFAGAGMINKNIVANGIAGVITITLDFLLIPKIGINGAAITSSISYTVCTIVNLVQYTNLTGSRLSEVLIIKKSDIAEIKIKINQIMKKRK